MAILFSDIEMKETLRRMKEVDFVFGMDKGKTKNNADSSFLIGPETTSLKQYVENLQEKEGNRRLWERKSPQIKYRKQLINLAMTICEKEKMSSQTTYLAIYLLDRFMDAHDVAKHHLPAVTVVCIVASGKLLEVNREIPKYRKLSYHLAGCARKNTQLLVSLEGYVLASFGFNIIVPTEVNFLEVFLFYAVDGLKASSMLATADANNNDKNNNNDGGESDEQESDASGLANLFENDHVDVEFPCQTNLPGAETLASIQETAYLILEGLTREGPQNDFAPSLVAAAIVLAARREHLLNFWTPSLEFVTTYSLEEVQECLSGYVEHVLGNESLSEPFSPATFLNAVYEPLIEDIGDSDDQE